MNCGCRRRKVLRLAAHTRSIAVQFREVGGNDIRARSPCIAGQKPNTVGERLDTRGGGGERFHRCPKPSANPTQAEKKERLTHQRIHCP